MNCPKCNEGQLRVVTKIETCCHPLFLVCEKCCAFFTVTCDPPYEDKLPPEFPISECADVRAAWKKTSHEVNRRLVEAGKADQQMSLDDCIRKMMKGEPTCEEFKAQLATIAIALDHDDCMQSAEDPDRKTQARKRLSPWIPAVLLSLIIGIISFCSIDDSKTLIIVLAIYAVLAFSFAIFMRTMSEKVPVVKKKTE